MTDINLGNHAAISHTHTHIHNLVYNSTSLINIKIFFESFQNGVSTFTLYDFF